MCNHLSQCAANFFLDFPKGSWYNVHRKRGRMNAEVKKTWWRLCGAYIFHLAQRLIIYILSYQRLTNVNPSLRSRDYHQ
jgi:hypothetical protein